MKKTLLLFLLILVTAPLFAQFNIEDDSNNFSISKIAKGDTLVTESPSQFSALSLSYIKEQRKKLRKSRNFFETKNSLLLTQFAYVNWAVGGTTSFNGTATSYFKHVYTRDNYDITTLWDAAYATGWADSIFWKTQDKFRINTAFNYRINQHFFYNVNFNLASQFDKGYSNKTKTVVTSGFFAPANINLGAGINYKLDAKRYVVLSPISGSMTVVCDEELSNKGAFGVEKGERTVTRFGALLNVEWTEPLFKDKNTNATVLSYRTSARSFWKYKGTPNLTWENWVSFNVYKYFNIGLNWTVKFDDTVVTPSGSFWQFSETLGIGMTYNFKNK